MYAKTKLFHLELYANTLHFDISTVYSDVEFGVKLCFHIYTFWGENYLHAFQNKNHV